VFSTNPPADGDINIQVAIGNRHRIYGLIVGLILTVLFSMAAYPQPAVAVQGWRAGHFYPSEYPIAVQSDEGALSPYWGPDIQQWGEYIGALSDVYGFHPDFIAAVIVHESDFTDLAAGGMGTNGLMGILPAANTQQNEPGGALAAIPVNNLRWGMAILSYVVQQSGGDLFTALAAYNGGWAHVNNHDPREYAARVLDSYARALVARAGLSPQMAADWTVAVEIRAGNVPADSLLILGNKPLAGVRIYVEHTVYAFANKEGRSFYVRGFVVPVSLAEYPADGQTDDTRGQLEAPLRARLGEKSAQSPPGNPRVLLACLLSLERLRGHTTTRWFSPSDCPAVDR
jgi:hypothetical protein